MPERPTVSVVIPLYNAERYILRSVASVLAQSFEDFELIVIDDGSTDEGPKRLIDAYGCDPRLRLLTQANAGVSAARNRGLSAMRGRLAAFLDADDEWMPEHLEDIIATAMRFPEAGLLATGYRQICSGGYVSEIAAAGVEPSLVADYFSAAKALPLSNMSVCAVTRQAYEALGGFLENEPYGEDTEFQARYAFHFPVACHPRVTAVYHREITTSAMGTCARKWSGELPPLVRNYRNWPGVRKADPVKLESLENYAAHVLYQTAVFHVSVGGNRQRILELLRHPLLRRSGMQVRAALAAWAVGSFALPVARLYYRLSRSRLFHRDVVSNGVSFRCISRW